MTPDRTTQVLSRAADVCVWLAAPAAVMALAAVVVLAVRPDDLADVDAVRDLGQACAVLAGANAAAWLLVRRMLGTADRRR